MFSTSSSEIISFTEPSSSFIISLGDSSTSGCLITSLEDSSTSEGLSISELSSELSLSVSSISSVSIIAIVCPTSTTSSTSKHFSIKTPFFSDGTSESTLSVAISTTASSNCISSPISFSQEVIVASASLSPIFGNFNSNLDIKKIW